MPRIGKSAMPGMGRPQRKTPGMPGMRGQGGVPRMRRPGTGRSMSSFTPFGGLGRMKPRSRNTSPFGMNASFGKNRKGY